MPADEYPATWINFRLLAQLLFLYGDDNHENEHWTYSRQY
jgi:hypothetical protein